MSKILNDITEAVGGTPLVRLHNMTEGLQATILVKIESMNPLGSAKDRVAKYMIEDAERRGLIKPGTTIVEPTSGNTGIGLAFISATRGYNLILTMPETMSLERRRLLQALGAKIELTPGEQGMRGAILRADEIAGSIPGSFIPRQFDNPANTRAHIETTAIEIWEDTGGNIDFFVAGVGTGGTISGTGEFLKEKNSQIQIVAVEPENSAVLSGEEPGEHKLQGLGAGFIPKIMNLDIVDEIMQISAQRAGETSKELARREGILAGISSGAALAGAIDIASREKNAGKTIIVLLPDSGERYLSTWLFDEDQKHCETQN